MKRMFLLVPLICVSGGDLKVELTALYSSPEPRLHLRFWFWPLPVQC